MSSYPLAPVAASLTKPARFRTPLPCKVTNSSAMREDLQVHDALGLIQPSDHWNGHPVVFATPHQVAAPLAHQPLDSCYSAPEPPEFMELVRQLPVAALEGDGFFVDDTTSADCFAPPPVEHRPRKAARRSHASGICTVEAGRSSETLASRDEQGLNLITLLMECAVAISMENLPEANRMLHELTQMASPYALSCAERVVAYFTKAMASRVMNSWTGICSPLIPHKSILSSFEAFSNICPFIKFAHFTANQAILEAFHQKDRIHIVDLDIMQGLQWPALFHILATRADGAPHVRMTGFGASMAVLEETGKQLSNFARRLGLPFEFHPIAQRPGDVHPSAIARRKGEEVAVHWLQHTLYDATGANHNTMRLLELLRPKVITLVEQEMAHAAGSFLDRFMGSLHYYCVVFDSLGSTLPPDDANRHRVEHGVLSREIDNILAIGGPARSGEQKFASWQVELARRGFAQVGMSRNAMAQAQLILNLFPPSLGYTILHGDGTLKLGWKDTGLYTASAWTAAPL